MAAFVAPASGLLNSLFGGIFQHHAQAVKNEAAALNTVVPEVLSSFTNIVKAANAGQISPEDAANYIDSALQQFDAVVYNQFHVKQKDCNGPCVVKKTLVAGGESIKAALRAGSGTATVGQLYGNAGFQGAAPTSYYVNIPKNSASALANSVTQSVTDAAGSVASAVGVDVNSLGTVAVGSTRIPMLYIIIGVVALLSLLLATARPSQPQVVYVPQS